MENSPVIHIQNAFLQLAFHSISPGIRKYANRREAPPPPPYTDKWFNYLSVGSVIIIIMHSSQQRNGQPATADSRQQEGEFPTIIVRATRLTSLHLGMHRSIFIDNGTWSSFICRRLPIMFHFLIRISPAVARSDGLYSNNEPLFEGYQYPQINRRCIPFAIVRTNRIFGGWPTGNTAILP